MMPTNRCIVGIRAQKSLIIPYHLTISLYFPLIQPFWPL